MGRQIKAMQAYLREQNKAYGALFSPIPRESWPKGFLDLTVIPDAVCRNRSYLVQIFPEMDGARRISVFRTMIDNSGKWEDGMTWDDLMWIKAAIGYQDRWAVEIYPPADATVNVANMRHIWLIADKPSYAW